MVCPEFTYDRNKLEDEMYNKCSNFKDLSMWDRFIYMLTCEGELAVVVGKFVYSVLSAKRNPPAR